MTNAPDLFYSALEVKSYLPSGWNMEAEDGSWNASKQIWHLPVQDVAEQTWDLEVSRADADKLGRIVALQKAIERLYRHS